jgi:hypothetical protein
MVSLHSGIHRVPDGEEGRLGREYKESISSTVQHLDLNVIQTENAGVASSL